jgi:filamentous hemagglutinin family protein
VAPVVAGGFLFLLPACLSANPTGGNVVAGSANITGQGTSAVTVNQASNIAIINWQTFSINSGESTSFLQPGLNSAALNRVLGGQTSLINGTLTANGQIYLINGNGVIVGPGGVIDASAFTASTRDITNANFLSGNLHFAGSSDAGVQNLGLIKALEGNVVLIGRTVDNEGTISAPRGTAGLIAGDNVLLAQHNADGSTITVSPISMAVKASSPVGVKNGGTITAAAAELKAASGNIYGLAVQNLGTIRATTVSHQGGHIWLTSGLGKVSNAGTLDASATAAGGKGGTVTLKSTNGTVSHTGQILARGGDGGTGGNAEISGANVQFTGSVDLSAPAGTKGTLLLDPATVDVVTGGGGNITASTVDPSAIVAALNTANVILNATLSITVDDAINASGNANTGNLSLAAQTVNLNAPIQLNGSLNGSASTVNESPAALIQNGVDAIGAAGGTVNLAPGATYPLSQEIVIDKIVNIEGNGATINGQDVTRIMEIDGGTVGLDGLEFVGGNGVSTAGAAMTNFNGSGGAILVYGSNTSASVSITDSTFLGNSAGSNSGGAICNVSISGGGCNVFLENDTFLGNTAVNGGVLYDDAAFGGNATFAMKEDSIAENNGNGAIYTTVLSSGNASVTINDSILAGNMNGGIESDYVNGGGGTLMDVGYNLYGQNGNAGGFVSTASTDILLAGAIGTVVGPLDLWGGTTPTLPLLAGSPAFNTGDPGFIGAPDQRGVPRGALTAFTGSATDIGAFEAQVVSVKGNSLSLTYGQSATLGYTITSGPATAAASISGSPELIVPASNVGNYGPDIGLGTLTSTPLYILNFTSGDLTITPATLAYVADPTTVPVGGTEFPMFTGNVVGFVGGDSLTTATTGVLTFNAEAEPDSPAGSYPITGSGLTANFGNYVFTQAVGNATALTIGTATPVIPGGPPAEQAATPNTPVSQAIAQTTSSTTTTDTDDTLPGGGDTPLVANASPDLDVSVTAISPNEFIDASQGQVSGSGSAETGALAQGSSFDPSGGTSNTGASNTVTVGETVTLGGGGGHGAPPPPEVVAQLAQVLSTQVYDTLSDALASASTAYDQGGAATTGTTTASATDQTGNGAGGGATGGGAASGGATTASSTAAGSSSAPNGPGSTGPATEVAPGQTVSISGGKAGSSGPPPAPVQAAFEQGFSPASRDELSKAAGN